MLTDQDKIYKMSEGKNKDEKNEDKKMRRNMILRIMSTRFGAYPPFPFALLRMPFLLLRWWDIGNCSLYLHYL